MKGEKKTVELPTGVTLEYLEQGDPQGVPVVFLHGLSDSCLAFEPVLRELPESVNALVPSQRGHGDSDKPEKGYGWGTMAEDIATFLDEKDVRQAVIVGHSMGSSVAQRLAIDHKERVLGLVLTASFLDLAQSPAPAELNEALKDMEDPVDPEFIREFQFSTLGQDIPEEFMQQVLRESQKLPARVWREIIQVSMNESFADRLSEIQAPTLLVWGDQDEMVTRGDQDALLDVIDGAHLEVYEGAGHAITWEEPSRLVQDLQRVVQNVAQRAR